jgi:hypothetical protein
MMQLAVMRMQWLVLPGWEVAGAAQEMLQQRRAQQQQIIH